MTSAENPLSPTLEALRSARGGRRRRRLSPSAATCVIGYTRTSTEEQAVSGLGLADQGNAIRAECERRGVKLCAVYTDEGISGTVPPDKRAGLAAAITVLDAGEAATLMVAKVDRLGRSFADLALLTPLAQRAGWAIVALNSPLDTSTPSGAAMGRMMAVFAALERDLIAERTKNALAVKIAQGASLGHPSKVSAVTRRRLTEMRASGMTWQAVADELNAKRVPSGSGVPAWTSATARRLAL